METAFSFILWCGIHFTHKYLKNENDIKSIFLSSLFFSLAYFFRSEGLCSITLPGLIILYRFYKQPKNKKAFFSAVVCYLIPITFFIFPYLIFLKIHLGEWVISGKNNMFSYALNSLHIDPNASKVDLTLLIFLKKLQTVSGILTSFLFINPIYYLLIVMGFIHRRDLQTKNIKYAVYLLAFNRVQNTILLLKKIRIPIFLSEISSACYFILFTLMSTSRPFYVGNPLEIKELVAYIKHNSIKCREIYYEDTLLINKIFIYLDQNECFIPEEKVNMIQNEQGKKYYILDVNYSQQMMGSNRKLENEINKNPKLIKYELVKKFDNKINGSILFYRVL
ncbi:MAG: hypothetical protein HQK51_11425 [Oligoflexia bacterium]|nr:hypothetical protein [Oligoflexia bacterium]